MKYIVPIAVAAIILLELSGTLPESSVGGPLTRALVFFAGALAVGFHDAWSNRRGVLGWIVNVPISLIGAFIAASVGNLIMEPILTNLNVGSLAESRHPLLYVTLAGMMLLMLTGSWLALKLVNRWR